MVHTDIVCEKSSYFKPATSESENKQDEATHSIDLLNVEPEIFEVYLHWVYTDDIDMDLVCKPAGIDTASTHHIKVVKLWLLGKLIEDHKFCDKAIDMILALPSNILSLTGLLYGKRVVECVWQNTDETSKLRMLFVDIYHTLALEKGVSPEQLSFWPVEIISAFAHGWVKQKTPFVIPKLAEERRNIRCRYHLHAAGLQCD